LECRSSDLLDIVDFRVSARFRCIIVACCFRTLKVVLPNFSVAPRSGLDKSVVMDWCGPRTDQMYGTWRHEGIQYAGDGA
jgi:hypothetical protein